MFKFNDYTCQICTAGYYGDWTNWAGTHTNQCTIQCATECETCFGAGNTNCLICKDNYSLQPGVGSTTCLSTCPPGYESVSKICVLSHYCHSSCTTCTAKIDSAKCASCSSTVLSTLNFTSFTTEGSCIPDISNTNYPNIEIFTKIDRTTSVTSTGPLEAVNVNEANATSTTLLSALSFNAG
jgi:hypothetical protein